MVLKQMVSSMNDGDINMPVDSPIAYATETVVGRWKRLENACGERYVSPTSKRLRTMHFLETPARVHDNILPKTSDLKDLFASSKKIEFCGKQSLSSGRITRSRSLELPAGDIDLASVYWTILFRQDRKDNDYRRRDDDNVNSALFSHSTEVRTRKL
ncbi:hypothetical protein KIN20_018347 [Parelaphostrongylus tenuis]|uniref:Uncharacterized protein n=1 Tax=Parelaphostrongylus tenuis TaxID=148309 RepID=A0AAD5N7D8_PARTN|nr:hypothetical protein KIN20_018347 [Parelaphostrongylus tenuis]